MKVNDCICDGLDKGLFIEGFRHGGSHNFNNKTESDWMSPFNIFLNENNMWRSVTGFL